LGEDFSESEAARQVQTIAGWSRYAQLLEYDADEQQLYRVEEEENVEETRD
jgi:hypothetical protein